MEKTVGEILEEQGVIRHREEEESKEEPEEKKISFLGEIRIKQLVMDIDKIKAEIEGLKEIKFSSDERIKELAESTGELRSVLFQKDNLTKELEAKIKLLEESISNVDPRKISKQLQKQEESITEAEARVEKAESIYRDMSKKFEESQKILESIRSVENLREKVSQMDSLVSKSIDTKVEIERIAGKTERFYSEIDDKIRELPKLKSETEKLNSRTEELAKAVDDINVKTTDFVKRDEVDDVKSEIDNIVIANKNDVENRLEEIENSLRIPQENINLQIEKLNKKKESVMNLISNLEEQYRKGIIKRETFEDVKSKNETFLSKIDDDIKKIDSQKVFSIRSLPETISEIKDNITILRDDMDKMGEHLDSYKNLESRVYVLENSLEDMDNGLKQVGPEKMVRMVNTINVQTGIVNDILTKLKEVNRRLMDAKVNLSDYENRTRLFEILNILVRLRAVDEISFYLNELEKLIFKMKLDKIWDREKQELTENILMEMSENWHEYGRNDVSKLFSDFLQRLKAPKLNR